MFVAAETLTTRAQYLRRIVLIGCLALMLVIGMAGTAHPVGATRISIDSGSAGCGIIADRINALIAEYGRVGRANPNDPQLDVILAQLRDAGRDWQTLGCYGSPIAAVDPIGPPDHLATYAALTPGAVQAAHP